MMHDDLTAQTTPRSGFSVSWWTVGVFAIVIAAADGFWATSLRGAVGYIEATQEPLAGWIRYLVAMLPLFLLTVLGALWLGHRLAGRRGGATRLGVSLLLVIALTTAVAIGEIALMAVHDYRIQADQLTLMHHLHDQGSAPVRVDPGVAAPVPQPCGGACSAKQQTLDVHVRAIGLASLVLLATNALLVLWALALRGGQLWARRRPAEIATSEADGRTSVVPA